MNPNKTRTGLTISAGLMLIFFVCGCGSTNSSALDRPEQLGRVGIMNESVQDKDRSNKSRNPEDRNNNSSSSRPPRKWGRSSLETDDRPSGENDGGEQRESPPENVKNDDGDTRTNTDQTGNASGNVLDNVASFPELLNSVERELQKMPGRNKAILMRAAIHHIRDDGPGNLSILKKLKNQKGDMAEFFEALTYYDIGENRRALKKLETIRNRWRRSNPIQIDKAVFVSHIKGFEQYERTPRVFSPGDFVKLYVRVSNFGTEKTAEGTHRASFQVTFQLYKRSWDPVESKETEKKIKLPSSTKKARSTLSRTYDFPIERKHLAIGIPLPEDIPQGDNYVIRLKVTDQIWNTTNKTDVRFRIQ